jgi:hypothetical protein
MNKMKVEAEETRKFKEGDSNKDDLFNQVDLKVEKEDVIKKDFYMNPKKKGSIKKSGNTFTFCYDISGNPLILIGPHCNIYLTQGNFISLLRLLFF